MSEKQSAREASMTAPVVAREWMETGQITSPTQWNDAVYEHTLLVRAHKATVAALRKYGRHTAGCWHGLPREDGSRNCTCKFDDALKAAGGTND